MLRFLTNSLKKPSSKGNSLGYQVKKFSFVKYPNSSSAVVQNKLNEKLSFLNSEEEMRKYFNIIDWDKKECEEIIQRKFKLDKEIFSQVNREYKQFSRDELFKIAQEFRGKLDEKNKGSGKRDYVVPSEVLYYKKFKNSGYDYKNEFSLDNIDFLKEKPKNYLLVSGMESSDIEEILNLFKSKGEVVQTGVIQDLLGRPSLIELYFYTDEEAQRAKIAFQNFLYKPGFILRVKDYMDSNRETVDNRTIVIKKLDKTLKPQQLIEYLSNQGGNLVKLEMPLEISKESNAKDSKLFKVHDRYFDELEKNMNTITASTLVEKSKLKNKLSFYLTQIHKLIKEFKAKLNPSDSNEVNNIHVNNLLVEIKFFMSKFFPNEVINGLIIPELEAIKEKNYIEEKINLQPSLTSIAYNKIIRNIENLLKKYEDRLHKLAKPMTIDEIPIDLFEIEANNKSGEVSFDQEKLDRSLIFENKDEKSQEDSNEINTEFKKMNFFATFHPLEQQIAKLDFIRSLSAEEKKLLKDKYNMNLSINTTSFLDYFINFSKAIGIKIIDKYIELSNLYMSMSPVEKVYHGKKLANKILSEDRSERVDQSERMVRENLIEFLELRKLKKLKSVHQVMDTKANFETSDNTRYLDEEEDILLADVMNILNKRLPSITMNEMISFTRTQNMYSQKLNYFKALIPINIAKKKLLIDKIRARMVKYNEVTKEFIRNYELLPKDNELRTTYDAEIKKLSKSIFGQVNSLDDVDLSVLNEDEDIGFGSMEKLRANPNKGKDSKKNSENYKRTQYKYTGETMKENQIVNRIEYIKSIRDKIVESVFRITNNVPYLNKRFDKISKQIDNKLKEYIFSVFSDDPKLQAHYLEKLKSKNEKFKYTKSNLETKKYKLEELAEDIIQREVDYARKVKFVRYYVDNMENVFEEKLSKGNLIKALSVYDIFYTMRGKFNDFEYLKNTPKFFYGSPVYQFFMNVKSIFVEEMNKVKVVKELKFNQTKKDQNLSLDELQNKKKELIEDYANKVESYRKAIEMTESEKKEIEKSTSEDLENYKLENLNVFVEDARNSNLKEKLFYNELKKKEFELLEKRKLNKPINDEEYKDISSLISNLNKISSTNTSDNLNQDGTEFSNILSLLNKKKLKNRGYAFVTFATSDEAKLFYLRNTPAMRIKKSNAEIFPKFDLTHEDVDEDLLYENAKSESKIINRRSELIDSEKKLKDFLQNFYDNLDSNEKHKEFESVREAFKDLYADPFKKHDRNNPLTAEEEDEVKYRAKLSGEDTTWLLEDDKIEKMRKIRDKRITKKYTEAEFLKRGIISEELYRRESDPQKVDEKYSTIKAHSDAYFNSTENYDLISDNNYSGNNGRKLKPIGTKEFIEKHVGMDYLDSTVPAFEKDKRESVIYEEIKELRKRFPREKFLDEKNGEDLIKEVNSKFVSLLKEEDKLKPNEVASEELLERITNISPMGKKIQMVINERNSKVQEEGVRQLMTIQHFYEKRLDNANARNTVINDIPEDTMDTMVKNQYVFENSPAKDYPEFIKEIYPLPFVPKEELKEEDAESALKTDGDTSFKAFLLRRRAVFDQKDEKIPEEKKDQFDPNSLSSEEISKVKEGVANELINSISKKYKQYFSQVNKTKSNIEDVKHDGGVYDYLQSGLKQSSIRNRSLTSEKNSQMDKKLQVKIKNEQMKENFLRELEKNFSDELQTLPKFRDYFINLKSQSMTNGAKSDINLVDEPIFNYSKYSKDFKPSSTRKEEMSLLYSTEKITPEIFEKTFVKNQTNRENRFKEWITAKDTEDLEKIAMIKEGIDLEDRETRELLRAEFPEVYEDKTESLLESMKKRKQAELDQLEKIQKFEEKDEVEYFFNPDCGETIEEHLAGLSKTKYSKVLVRTDKTGRLIIRKEYKNNYKYDLDEIMQYDITKEREKMLKKLENFDFKTELEANVEYYSQFYQFASNYDCFNQTDILGVKADTRLIVQKVEDYQKLSYENFSFNDFKRLTDNLLQMKPRSLTNFVNHVIQLINLVSSPDASGSYQEISEVLKEISEFSKDIFNEREVRIFVDLIKSSFENISLERVKEFDNMSKFYFIQNILLKDFFKSLSNLLTQKEVAYIYGILKLLPVQAVNLSSIKVIDAKPKLKKILWKNYKNFMLREFNIIKKKEKEINPDSYLDIVSEQYQVLQELKNESNENLADVEKEIEEFGVKLRNYYAELANASKKYI